MDHGGGGILFISMSIAVLLPSLQVTRHFFDDDILHAVVRTSSTCLMYTALATLLRGFSSEINSNEII